MSKHVDPAVKANAVERALYTLWQGVGVDALILIGLGLSELLATADVTSQFFWISLAGLALKSILTSLASYLTHMKRGLPQPADTA